MSNYTKSTNFATKDNLTPGDPLKIVRGTEIDTEFNNIATAIATKTDNASAAITGGSITGITDLAIADGGTGASTANAALNNLLPSQTSASGKYLKSNGTDSSWDALDISTADITGTLPVANGGTGVTSSTGTGSVVLSNSPTLVTPALGTPASGVATNITGLPISTGVSGLGTGVATALAVNVGSAGAPLVNGGVLGTPSSGTATNLTGLPLTTGVTGTLPIANGGTGQTTANAAFNALAPSQATASGKYLKSDGTNTSWDALDISTADITGTLPVANGGTGVTTSTGTGSVVLSNSPTLVTPALGTPSSATLTNATGLPISTGVSGLGTGVATALGVAVGSAGAPVVNGGALGTPSSGTVTNLTGTASININGTVGATTPTTGAFTTTTVSTSETLSYGTANGVTYLNGSKVLTSGSALTFDGQYVSIGSGATNPNGIKFLAFGGGLAANLTVNHSTGEIQNFATTNYFPTWYANNAEQMRLTSTGLGIGTSSPAYKLDVNGNVNIGSTSSVDTALFVKSSTVTGLVGAQSSYSAWSSGGLTTAMNIGTTTNNGISFGTNNIGRLNLDSAGNLGLGVTPSASTLPTIQSAYGALSGNTNISIVRNAYYNGGWKYTATGAATFYQHDVGSHIWYNTASGTAGTAITWTQAMTLDASGNLGVGTTSPVGILEASSATPVITASQNNTAVTSDMMLGAFNAYSYDTSTNSKGGVGGVRVYAGSTYNTGFTPSYLAFYTHDNIANNNTLLGAATERARIDSSGNFTVGNTTGSSLAQQGINLVGGIAASQIYVGHASGVASGQTYMAFTYNAATIGSITQSGTTAVLYNVTSDQRLKENIVDAPEFGSVIDSIKVRSYDWKADGNHQRAGFIAQELVTVAPEAVHQPTDTEEMMAVDYSKLVPMLVKEIQSLRQRVAQLETN